MGAFACREQECDAFKEWERSRASGERRKTAVSLPLILILLRFMEAGWGSEGSNSLVIIM